MDLDDLIGLVLCGDTDIEPRLPGLKVSWLDAPGPDRERIPDSYVAWEHWVTLYTDASWSHLGVGAYGCRARNAHPPHLREISGRTRRSRDSVTAELEAVLRGVDDVLASWERVDGIGVRTDCQAAVDILSPGAKPHRRDDIREMQERLVRVLAAKADTQGYPCRIRLVWVKGHQRGPDGRTGRGWLNNRVDALAGKVPKRDSALAGKVRKP